MNKEIKYFYDSEKPLVEVTSFLLVITGIFLNLQSENILITTSLRQIKFLLLSLSLISLIYLIKQVFVFFILPIRENTSTLLYNPAEEPLIKLKNTSRAIVLITFFTIISSLFSANLLIYLFLSYPMESLFLGVFYYPTSFS